jgi:hypothetical protein
MHYVPNATNHHTDIHCYSSGYAFTDTFQYRYKYADWHIHKHPHCYSNLDFRQYADCFSYAFANRDSFLHTDRDDHIYGNFCGVGKYFHICPCG